MPYKETLLRKLHCMKARCYNTDTDSYPRYGGKGITVCDEWLKDKHSFVAWGEANGWEEGLEIDRIDNELGYSPDNCRFATRSENQLNRRIQKNNTSGYRGVSWLASNKCWRYKIQKKVVTGFSNKVECALARDMDIIKQGLNAPLTFTNIANNAIGGYHSAP